MDDEPKSKSVDKFYTSDKTHFITVAEWNGYWGKSYEVGLRDMKTKEFTLAASYLDTEEEALLISKAIKDLLERGWKMSDMNHLFPGLFK